MSYWLLSGQFDPQEAARKFSGAGLRVPRFLIDSGVYSARQKNVAIGVEGYAGWLRTRNWGRFLQAAIDVDYPSDHEIVKRHTATLRLALGAGRTWPVLHPFMTDAQVESVCDAYRWCAVGNSGTGLATDNQTEFLHNREAYLRRLRWYHRVHSLAYRYGTRLHALGTGGAGELMRSFDWASADASMLAAVQRYGVLWLWDGQKLACHLGGTRATQRRVSKRTADGITLVSKQAGFRGFRPEKVRDLAVRHRFSVRRVLEDLTYRSAVSVVHIAKMERYYDQRNSRGFIFFVADRNVNRVVEAYKMAVGLVARRDGLEGARPGAGCAEEGEET
jgi:hypothetical protein